jgi:putative hydrolase of the HAD superfamily
MLTRSRPGPLIRYTGGVKAILLDLDDTLLDYSGGVEDCWSTACVECCASAGVDATALLEALRPTRRWFWDDPERHRRERTNMLRAWQNIVMHAMERIGPVDEALAAAVARDFAARRRRREQLFPEALDVLDSFRNDGIPLGLVTNGDASFQRDKIERHRLARYFDVIVIEGEFGAGKPDEVVYRHALERLKTLARDACMIGDNLVFDVDGAQRLGIAGIWIDRDGAGLPADSPVRPDRVIRSLKDLPSAL